MKSIFSHLSAGLCGMWITASIVLGIEGATHSIESTTYYAAGIIIASAVVLFVIFVESAEKCSRDLTLSRNVDILLYNLLLDQPAHTYRVSMQRAFFTPHNYQLEHGISKTPEGHFHTFHLKTPEDMTHA